MKNIAGTGAEKAEAALKRTASLLLPHMVDELYMPSAQNRRKSRVIFRCPC
jgi:hypothetical protein